MKDKREQFGNIVLRVISAVIITSVIALLFIIYMVSSFPMNSGRKLAKAGKVDISGTDFAQTVPVFLDGEWEYYPGVFFEGDTYEEAELGVSEETVTLPVSSLMKAREEAAYRLLLKADHYPGEGLVLYIPVPNSQVRVFFNGQALQSSEPNQGWINYSKQESIFNIQGFDQGRRQQELVICVNQNGQGDGIYKRSLAISTLRNISTLSFISVGNEMLILGLLLLIMISSYIFMLFRPGHKMITGMTIFDTMLMLRIVFNLKYAMAFFENIFSGLSFTDSFCLSAQIFFLMLAGLSGMALSQQLYDPEKKTPKILTIPVYAAYISFALIFPFNLELFDKVGMPAIVAVFIYTFFGVFYQYSICLKRGFSWYYLIQIIKTGYVGILVFIDIMLLNRSVDYLYLVLLYSLFFIVHVAFRLYDNNDSYRQVERLNQTLENTVVERTRELEDANRILSELSIRDPLTKAYNRLYFERTAEILLHLYEAEAKSAYLCIFDLDLFKRVNDKFGHDEGDRQLVFVAETGKALPPQCTFSRIGGEEFTILFSDCDDDFVLDTCAEMKAVFEQSARENRKRTTISMGIAKFRDGMNMKLFFKMADTCLYEAKNTGRNKICYNFAGEMKEV